MTFPLRSLTAAWSILFLLLGSLSVSGQESAAEDSSAIVAESTDDDQQSQAAADSFALPDDLATAEDYLELLPKLVADNQPEAETMEAVIAHNKRMARTVLKLSEKVFSLQPEDETQLKAYNLRLQALQMLERFEEPGTGERVKQLIEKLRNDAREDFQALGFKYYIESGLSRWPNLTKAEKQERLTALTDFIKKGEPDAGKINTVLSLVSVLQQFGDLEFAKALIAETVPQFEKSDNPQIVQRAEIMRGLVRRLDLPGNKLELSGTMLDGSELDWESYRGKVVLVDFWATWCGPCRMEFPNVIRQYELYKDKGFEVLGISLDDDRAGLESFLSENDLPWQNLFAAEGESTGFEHPMARYYGVMAIPQTILVDQEGKVVSLSARGEALNELLLELLGEPGNASGEDAPEADPS